MASKTPTGGGFDPDAFMAGSAPKQQPTLGDKVGAFFGGAKETFHPLDALGSLPGMLAHPIDTVKSIEAGREQVVDRAKAAIDKGDYVPAAIHSALSLIPLVGPAISQHYQEMRDAQNAGDNLEEARAAGRLMGIAGTAETLRNAPAVIAKAPGIAAKVATGVANAAGATGAGISAAAPDVAVGAAKVGIGGAAAEGIPGIGHYIGAVAAYQGGRDIISGIAKGVKAGAFSTRNAEAINEIPTGPATVTPPLYDELAQSKLFGAKDYASLPADQKAAVQRIAAISRPTTEPAPAQPAAVPDPNVEPVPLHEIGPQVKPQGTIADLAAREIKPKAPVDTGVPANAPQAPDTPGLRIPLRPPLATAVTPETAPPPSAEPVAVSHADSIKPEVAATLKAGDTRTLINGRQQILKDVPLDSINKDQRNVMYQDKVDEYRANPSPLQPWLELDPNEPGKYMIHDGSHRIEAAQQNGEPTKLSWTPLESAEPTSAATTQQTSQAPAPLPTPSVAESFKAKARADRTSNAQVLYDAGYTADTMPLPDSPEYANIGKDLNIDMPITKLARAKLTKELRSVGAGAAPQEPTLELSQEMLQKLANNPKLRQAMIEHYLGTK